MFLYPPTFASRLKASHRPFLFSLYFDLCVFKESRGTELKAYGVERLSDSNCCIREKFFFPKIELGAAYTQFAPQKAAWVRVTPKE